MQGNLLPTSTVPAAELNAPLLADTEEKEE